VRQSSNQEPLQSAPRSTASGYGHGRPPGRALAAPSVKQKAGAPNLEARVSELRKLAQDLKDFDAPADERKAPRVSETEGRRGRRRRSPGQKVDEVAEHRDKRANTGTRPSQPLPPHTMQKDPKRSLQQELLESAARALEVAGGSSSSKRLRAELEYEGQTISFEVSDATTLEKVARMYESFTKAAIGEQAG